MGSRSDTRPIALAAGIAWVVLSIAALGVIPSLRHAWGLNLWLYHPTSAVALLALIGLALCLPGVQRKLTAALSALAAWLDRSGWLQGPRADLGLLVVATLCFWLLRERQSFGDSSILVWAAVRDLDFHLPELGASFMIGVVLQLGHTLTGDMSTAIEGLRLSIALAGGVFLVLLRHALRLLVPDHVGGAAVLLLSGGLLRLFAGHAEVYAYLFVALAGFVWAAAAYMEGRYGWLVPCAALGAALWLHASALCLAPGLLALRYVGRGSAPRPGLRELALGATWVLMPTLLFVLGSALLGEAGSLAASARALLAGLSPSPSEGTLGRWIRLPGSGPGIGTDYVLLSLGHLKYIANALYLLVPFALPVLVATLCLRPRTLIRDARGRFLVACCGPLVLYVLALRPIWGPYDWDLFAISAFFLALLALHCLDTALSGDALRSASLCLAGLGLVFVGIPFLAAGVHTARPAGPFAHEHKDWQPKDPFGEPPAPLRPWL